MGLINRMAESIRLGIKNFLQITPASDKTITVTETSNHLTECFINRIWYWGNSRQLAELYRQIDTNKTMFWAAKSTEGLEIRKIHTGLPALICETLVNIVIADYNGTDVTSKNSTAYAERWEDIEKQNKLSDTVKQMLRDLCVVGDGAFKVSFDTAVSDVPIVEWYPAENIDFTYVRGRIREVKFYTDYTQKHRRYRFEETYGYGYIHYALYNDNGKEIDLHTVDALSWIDSKGVTFGESYMWAVPVLYGKSCHKGRGAGIIGIKTDAFDSLDEVWSQWMDALRACRTKQYVPDCLVPRNPETCQPISPNPFDNRFITVGNDMSENGNGNRIYTESPQIQHESYLSSYITALDLCLQGIISPSTLGIDTKKLDNADAQREKEKTTLYTRQNLVKITQNALQSLVAVVLNADGELNGNGIVEGLEVSVNFGEYANPSFESQVKGQEQWRQLVYMLGTVYDKYEYLGDAVLNQKEKELLGVIEFAPFREWSPIKESLEGRYPSTYEGIDRMMALAREAGDISFVRLLRIYYKHPSKRVEYFLSRRLLSHKREKLYVLIWHKIKAASEAYDKRDYGSSQNEDIKTKRRVIDSRLQSEGYSGKYPEYRKGDVQIIVTEEHPFTIMESEEFVFRTQFMVSKCIKPVKGGRNSGFFTGWGRKGKVEDTLEASLREADRMGQTKPRAHQEAVKGEDR